MYLSLIDAYRNVNKPCKMYNKYISGHKRDYGTKLSHRLL